MGCHDFAIIIHQHTIMCENIVCGLKEIDQIHPPSVISEVSAFHIARLVNLDSNFVWNVRPGLLLKVLEALAGRHERPTLGRMQDSHVVFLWDGLPRQ